jgi:hypothetical protein
MCVSDTGATSGACEANQAREDADFLTLFGQPLKRSEPVYGER